MKPGHKGNQDSLIILHEFLGHMIKVKCHLGSMNFDHQSHHCWYIELRNAGETASTSLSSYLFFTHLLLFVYMKSLFAKGVRSTLDHSEKIHFFLFSHIAIFLCETNLSWYTTLPCEHKIGYKRNLPVFIFFKYCFR